MRGLAVVLTIGANVLLAIAQGCSGTSDHPPPVRDLGGATAPGAGGAGGGNGSAQAPGSSGGNGGGATNTGGGGPANGDGGGVLGPETGADFPDAGLGVTPDI
jgi:hypothetical protein